MKKIIHILFIAALAAAARNTLSAEVNDIAACTLNLHEIATEDLENSNTIRPVELSDRLVIVGHRKQGLLTGIYSGMGQFQAVLFDGENFLSFQPSNQWLAQLNNNRQVLARLQLKGVSRKIETVCIDVSPNSIRFTDLKDCGKATEIEANILPPVRVAEVAYVAYSLARVDEVLIQIDDNHKSAALWPEIKDLKFRRPAQTGPQSRDRFGRFISLVRDCAKKTKLSELANAYSNMARRLEIVSARFVSHTAGL